MPRRRIGRPGLLGTMARTAVVAGTANATINTMNRRHTARAQSSADAQAAQRAALESQAQLADLQAQMAAAPPPPPAPAPASGGDDDLMAQLQQLADMRQAGILDDAEFAAAKAKLLG
jgi:hypothetical protein